MYLCQIENVKSDHQRQVEQTERSISNIPFFFANFDIIPTFDTQEMSQQLIIDDCELTASAQL